MQRRTILHPSGDRPLNEDIEIPIRILNQNGQCISYDDETIELLGDFTGRQLQLDSASSGKLQKRTTSLLRRDDGGRLPNAGTFAALRWRARRSGIDLRRRITPALVSLPAPTHSEHLWYPQVADFMMRTALGQIGLSRGVTPVALIGDAAVAFPDAQIIVVGAHRPQLDKIAAILQARRITAVSISSRKPLAIPEDYDDNRPRVICTTPCEAATTDFATAEIVIVLDAHTCMHRDAQLALSQVEASFRLYALFDVEAQIAPSAIDAAFAVFGPEVIRITAPRQSRRETCFTFVQSTPPRNSLERTHQDFAAACYWHHSRRNRRIAQLAGQLHVGDMICRRKFPEVARAFPHLSDHRPSVTVLVDRPCHAVALARELAGWPVIAADAALRGTCRSFRQRVLAQRREWNAGTNQIVLVDAAHQFRGETSDVIIWAGGGDSIDYIPSRWLAAEYASERPLLIVDIRDQHNSDALALSRCRERAYVKQDIYPPGFSAAEGRLDNLLHRQPQERRS